MNPNKILLDGWGWPLLALLHSRKSEKSKCFLKLSKKALFWLYRKRHLWIDRGNSTLEVAVILSWYLYNIFCTEMSYKEEQGDSYADSKSDDEDLRKGESKSDVKADSKSDSKLSDDELLKEVQEFFYCNEELAEHFESFINRRSVVVDLSSEEYKLEYTAVFNEYKRLFEEKIEGFITEILKSTVQDFYYALKAKSDAVEESSESIFAQILIAVTDFDVFMTMMREAAAANERLSADSDHK